VSKRTLDASGLDEPKETCAMCGVSDAIPNTAGCKECTAFCMEAVGCPVTPSGIEAIVCEDIARRQQIGIAKYRQTVADNPLSHRQWLEHAYQECLDMAVYLRRAMEAHQ
jgi:hypothetical protein